jgi:conjugative relaxase-like TrwC/TraI family protein
MLTISKPLSAGQAQTYHAKEFTAPEQNYWKQGDEIKGEWHGKLAAEYGLHDAVLAKDFSQLSEGKHPETGEQLVRHRKVQEYQSESGKTIAPVEHRAGWDATFSAPKSVSLTALVGGDDRVRQAHHEAVNIALDELERYTQARIGGNHAAQTTGQFIAAKFEHDTARPVDGYAAPQLHTHAVIFNLTQLDDGSTRALQPRALFESQQFATAVYQSQLTYQLRNLGYELESGRSGAPEIKGYSREYLDASSPRRQQIEEALTRSGRSGAEASEIAAHNTRDKKAALTPNAVMAAHRHLAAEYGNQARLVVQEARERALGLNQTAARTPDLAIRAQDAMSYARDRNIEREAVTDERALFRDALRRGMGDLTYSQVRINFDARVAAGEFQSVPSEKHVTGRQFTTQEAIRAERDVLARMQRGQDQAPEIMSKARASKLADTRPQLNAAQHGAIEQVLSSRDQVQGLQGLAGTGKTTTLEAIRLGAEQNGYAVEGFAPTSRAARQLREASIPADTLQGFLARGGQQYAAANPSNKHLYMVDESSLASTKQMRDFLSKINPQDKVLLVGDTRQHQGVDAGKPFEDLQQAGMRTAQLDQIIRQKEPGLLQAVEHFSKNKTAAGVALLHEQGRVTEIADPKQRTEAIAKQYAANPTSTIIVSPDNASRLDLNQAVRQELQAAGIVAATEHSFRVLAPRSDMTGVDRAWAAHYDIGDVLYYHRGSKGSGLDRHSYARVVANDPKENLLTVQNASGEPITYDPARLRGVSTYREVELSFAVGDRLQFTAPNRELGVANRDIGIIEAIGKDSLTVRLPEGDKAISFDPKAMPHFDHGYAVTSHSAQGLTTERVLVNIDSTMHPDLINTRLAYVSISRASHEAHIFTNDASGLAEALSRDVTKASAMPPSQTPENLNQQPTIKETAMPNPQNTQTPIAVENERPIQQAEPSLTAQALPPSIYAAQLPPEVILQDIKTTQQGIADHLPGNTIALNIVEDHWKRNGEQIATAAHVYAADLYQSVSKHPEYGPEQRIEQMQPSPTERQQWEPLIRAVPLEVADSFNWTGSNGTVQSYQQESTQNYLHIDGHSGQFYDRDKNAISPTSALDRALPDEFRHQIHRSEEPSISQAAVM